MGIEMAIEMRSTGTSPRPAPGPRGRRATRLVWAIVALALVVTAALVRAYLSRPVPGAADVVSSMALLVSVVTFVVSGAIIVSQQPGNVIGWLLMLPGLVLPASDLATFWLVDLDPPPVSVGPVLWLVLWTTGIAWVALIFPIFHILLTFPNGRLLSPRWRVAVALEVVMILAVACLSAFSVRIGPLVDDTLVWSVTNPVGFVPDDILEGIFGLVWTVGLVALSALAAAALVVRFRRGSGEERHQLKWPAAAALLFGVTYGVASVDIAWSGGLFAVGIAAIPVSVAIAITRYHLYDIDRIISRTVAYGLITALLAAAFVLTNVAVQALFARGTTFEVAISTLVVAMLFQPIRRAIQRPIDRRFNRSRVDAELMVVAFAARTRDEVDLPTLSGELSLTAARAVEPSSTAIWIRGVDAPSLRTGTST